MIHRWTVIFPIQIGSNYPTVLMIYRLTTICQLQATHSFFLISIIQFWTKTKINTLIWNDSITKE
jgi:hypothetical protein